MTLPTPEEIRRATVEAGFEPEPLPLADCCDRSVLREWIRAVIKMTGADEQIIKTGLVHGLNIGIRIGEARARRINTTGVV